MTAIRTDSSRRSPAAGSDEDENICAICCEDTATVDEVARPAVCQHRFCRGCLEQLCRAVPPMSGQQALCPLDRKAFDKICVTRRRLHGRGGAHLEAEIILDAATLVQLQRLFDSPQAPAVLGFALLAVTCSSPGWLIVAHLLAVSGLHCATGGIVNWTYYNVYMATFYGLLAPGSLIGPAATLYACCSCCLLFYCAHAMAAELRLAGGLTAEKVLFAGTAALVWTVYPILLLSVYTVLQVYCYTLCLILGATLHSSLSQCHGPQYVRRFVQFSGIFFMPYVCQLKELPLVHLVYIFLVISASLYFITGEQQVDPQLLASAINIASSLACSLAPPVVLLGFSLWTALYCVAAVTWTMAVLQRIQQFQRVRHLLALNVTMVMLLLPWKLFGLLSYLACLVAVLASCFLTGKLVEQIEAATNRQVVVIFYHWAAVGILAPLVLF